MELELEKYRFKNTSKIAFSESRLVFFAGNNNSSSEKNSEEEKKEDNKQDEEELNLSSGSEKLKAPSKPADSASLEDWLKYEKEVNRTLLKLNNRIAEKGTTDLLEKSLKKTLRAAQADAKESIKNKRRKREKEAAGPSAVPRISDSGIIDNRLALVRRFLKSSELLLMPEEREKGANSVFTDWELSILDLHDVEQEIHLLYRGRKLYVGSEAKDADLQQKSDLILKLESDLENDKKIFETNKVHYSSEEQKKKKKDFLEREQRIEDLRKKKEQEMYVAINNYIDQLEEKRQEKKKNVIDKMLVEFSRRVDSLIQTWTDAPDQYKHNQKKTLKNLNNMKDFLANIAPILKIDNKLLRHKRLFEECGINSYLDEDLKALRAFDMQLDACEMRSNAKAEQLSEKEIEKVAPPVDDLEAEFKNWDSRHKKIFDDLGFIDSNKEDVLAAMEGVKSLVEATPVEDFTGDPDFPEQKENDKKERLDTLDKNYNRVKENDISLAGFEEGYKNAEQRIRGLIEDIKKSDPNSAETIEKRRTLKEAIDISNKYFDEINEYKKDLAGMKDKLKMYSENKQKFDQVIAESDSISVSVRWLTGTDILRIWEKFSEWGKRRWDRKSDDRIGDVGSKLFDIPGLNITKSLANEFDKVKENAEISEVNQYKDAFSNKDAWQIEDLMINTKNKDEFKACLTLLSEKGRLRFDSIELWKQLEFFQGTIKICENYDDDSEVMWLKDHPMELHDRLHKAIGYIWDFDTYYGFKNAQDNNYDSGKSNWKKRCDQISEVQGGLSKRLRELLNEYRKDVRLGRTPRINPHEYEAIIEYAIDQGKMSPEARLYYIIQGIDCGLLEYPDRLSYFAGRNNIFPAIDAITTATFSGGKPTKADISNWAKIDRENNTPGEDFIQWYWTLVSHRPAVLQRIDKTLTQGANRLDHDDVVSSIAFCDANTIKNMLSKNYGGEYGLPQTGFMNIPVAYLKYLDNWSLNAKYIDNAVIQLKRFASSFALYYSVTQEDRRMYKNKDYYRYSEHLRNDPNGPRAAGSYATEKNRGVQTVNEYLERTKNLFSNLDKPLFDKIFDPSLSRNNALFQETLAWMKNYLGKQDLFGAYDPKNYEELIEQGVPKILDAILSGSKGKDRVRRMVESVKNDIKSHSGAGALRDFDNVVGDTHFNEPALAKISGKNIQFLPGVM